MLNLFVCGSGTFHREEEAETWSNSPCSSPKKHRRKSHNKDSKNPYSTRGLDKFSEVLADLEEKRNKIYSQVGSQDISLVRFMHSNSNDWVPIVVKSKNNNIQDKTQIKDIVKDQHDTTAKSSVDSKEPKQQILESNEKPKKKRFFWNIKLDRWRRPSYYLPVIVIFILLLLAVFGRSFAVLCTSIGWYLVPALKMSPNTKRSTKKRTYANELRENKMVVSEKTREYTRSSSGLVEGKSPQQHGHRKSW